MPIPKPRGGESQNKFVSRCIGFLVAEGRPTNQAAAICYDKWRNKDMGEKMGKINEIYDDIQEDNPVRAQGNITAGQGRGYEGPEKVIAGRYDEFETGEEQVTPRSSDQDLDDLFPTTPKK
jgi:hypothetical protein